MWVLNTLTVYRAAGLAPGWDLMALRLRCRPLHLRLLGSESRNQGLLPCSKIPRHM